MPLSELLSFLLFALMASARSEASEIPSVSDYFDTLRDDMTRLTWAHAVNSQALLKKALDDEAVMMLEADVVLGRLDPGGTNDSIPIMAHPPSTTSDLSLDGFLTAVVEVQKTEKKGVKLDFKSIEAFLASLVVMETLRDSFTFPVWLNADILRGPIDSQTTPVDAKQFLKGSSKSFPTATLSLGWTTSYGPGQAASYTDEQLTNMFTAITTEDVRQPITLAVRAGIAAQTLPGMKSLVERIDGFQNTNSTTLTIWMSRDTDPVDVAQLKNLILSLGREKVFLDVPEDLRQQLVDTSSGKTPLTGAMGAFATVLTSVSALFTNAFKLFD